MKIRKARGSQDKPRRAFFCPGCEMAHYISVGPGGWKFNEDYERPTISPSILVSFGNDDPRRCHSYVKAGKIQFLNDCSHALKGQTVELPDWEDAPE